MSESLQNSSPFDYDLAIVIGIDDYQGGIPKLKTARNDAKRLADILEKQHSYEVELFTDENERATFRDIWKYLKSDLPEKIKQDKDKQVRLLFYFAGHGTPPQGEEGEAGYLLPQDAEKNKTDKFLSMKEIHDELIQLGCHHLLIILDCCYAGAFRFGTRDLDSRPEELSKERYDRYKNNLVGQVIASAAHDQKALDVLEAVAQLKGDRGTIGNSNHSPFAESLFATYPEHSPFAALLFNALEVKVLEGDADHTQNSITADYTKDGITTVTELSSYLSEKLRELTEHQNQQVCRTWCLPKLDKGEFFFVTGEFNPDNLPDAIELNKDNNPYRGLESFEEAHSRLFFGRNQEINDLKERIDAPDQPLTVVLGNSGSGKSSLVKAGLIPKLRENPTQWRILEPMRPGATPFKALARAVLPLALEESDPDFTPLKQLDDLLRQARRKDPDDKELKDLFAKWRRTDPEEKLLLIIKHFSCLEKLCQDCKEQLIFKDLKELRKMGLRSSRLVLNNLAELEKCCDSVEKEQLNGFHKKCIKEIQDWSEKWKQAYKEFGEFIKECSKDKKVLLVIDQFEELITQCSEADQQQFLAALQATLDSCPQLHLVLTLRDDFQYHFEDEEPLKSHWKDACFRLEAMRRDQLREAIEKPAQAQVLFFEEAPRDEESNRSLSLVDQILDDLGNSPGALPLLSFILSELYHVYIKSSRDNRTLTQGDYNKLGGVKRALTRRFRQEATDLAKNYQSQLDGKTRREILRQVMLRMVTVSGGELARRRVPTSELEYNSDAKNGFVNAVIDRFTDVRLFVKGEDAKGRTYVEPAHDVLVRVWQKHLDKEEENLLLQRQLTPEAEKWKSIQDTYQDKYEKQPKRVLDKARILNWLDEWLLALESFLSQTFSQLVKLFLKGLGRALGLFRRLIFLYVKRAKKQALRRTLIHKILSRLMRALQPDRNQSEQLGEKLTQQFLWHNNPNLDRLQKELNSNHNWLNKVEQDFVIESLRRKRWNRSWGRRIARTVTTVIVIFAFVAFIQWINAQKQLVSTIGALTNNSQELFESNKEFDALLASLTAAKQSQLIEFGVDLSMRTQIENTLRDALFWVREQNRLEGHLAGVNNISFSPDGRVLATGSVDGIIKISEASTGKELRTLNGNSFSFSPDGRVLATSSADGIIRILDVSTGKELRTLNGNSFSFSPDGRVLATSSADGIIRILDVSTGKELQTFGNYISGGSIIFSPQGILASVNTEGMIQLWDINTGQVIKILTGHRVQTNGINFSANGQILSSQNTDGTITLWNAINGEEIRTLPNENDGLIDSVSFSPDGQLLAVAGENQIIKLWNIISGEKVILAGHGQRIRSVSFSPDGQLLASASWDSTVKLWDVATGKEIETFTGHRFQVERVAFNPNGQLLASASNDKTIRLWRITSQAEIIPLSSDRINDGISFSPDGTLLASTTHNSLNQFNIQLWNVATHQVIATLIGHSHWIRSASFSPDGQWLTSAAWDGTVRLWDVRACIQVTTCEAIEILESKTSPYLSSVSFSPDGRLIASSDDDWVNPQNSSIQLWDASIHPIDNQPIKILQGHTDRVRSITFNRSGNLLASGSADRTIKLWDLDTLTEIKTFKGHTDWINGISFSPNRALLASASNDQSIKIWDTASGQEIRTLRGHTAPVVSVSFSSNGQWLVSASSDRTIKFWDVDTGQEIRTLRGHRTDLRSFSLSSDDQLLASVGAGELVVWNVKVLSSLTLEQLMEKGCDWVRGYLENNPNVSESDRHLCDGIEPTIVP